MGTYLTKYAEKHGLKMVDGRRSVRLEVEPRDVAEANQGSSKSCAFACAAKRIDGVKRAYFFRSTAWLEFADRLERYILPPAMQKEIVSFDRGAGMATGTYQLSRPVKSMSMAAFRARSQKRKGRHLPGKTRIKRGVVHRTSSIRTLAEPRA